MAGKVLTSWSLLWILVMGLLVAGAALNLAQRAGNALPPTDGVLWTQRADGIYAEKVLAGFPASRAGISEGDKLLTISLDGKQADEVVSVGDIAMYLDAAGVGGSLTYFFEKRSYSFSDNRYFADLTNLDTLPRWTPSIVFLGIVGLVWLGVGLFVLFKQGSRSPFVLHFATLCLAAFVFHVYQPINTGQDLDLAIQVLDNIAFAFFVPLFVHFCLRYPVRGEVFGERRWRTLVLYAPAAIFSLSVLVFALIPLLPISSVSGLFTDLVERLKFWPRLNFALLIQFVVGVSAGSGILLWRFLTNRQPIVRQRLKWSMWGTLVSIVPILSFQIANQFVHIPEDTLTVALTTLPLALIPLSFGHSVVRYRLMDVDIVVRRAFVYAATTIALATLIGAVALSLVFLIRFDGNLTNTEIALRSLLALIAMAAIVMLSEPLKNFLQERVNRFFYGERYDLRRGLLDFGRTLSATTALAPLLESLADRLVQVLDVEKLALLMERSDRPGEYFVTKSVGLSDDFNVPPDFRQMVREKSSGKGVVRADEFLLTEDDSNGSNGHGEKNGNRPAPRELHYFVPCVARGKMVAVIGLGRGKDGSLLTSEDLDILRTVSGYIAVAIENSRLYQEQQEHTEELALLKEFNESIVESVNVGLLAVDEIGVITRCNSTFEEMMSLSRSEVVGQRVEKVFDGAFAANLSNILGRGRWHLTEIRNAYKLHTSDALGRSLVLNIAVAPLRSISTEQTGAIVVLENVTSRIKLEESLQQSEKLSSIGLLAAGVAHEVNTPLTGVSSYTQMLLGMIPETDPKHALLQKMQRQTDRASNIVGNLLNFSRTGGAIEPVEVDINKLLDDTLQLLEPQLRSSQISIIKEYDQNVPRILGDPGKLQQVFTNLILNARDAILGEGTVTLRSIQTDAQEVVIDVVDTGEGIPEENLKRIFDPFFTTKGVGNGTGLGLAVTYGIVQEHAGSIEAMSENGNGSTIRLVFPLAGRIRQRAVS